VKILGIDPAINVTGYGLIQVNGRKLSLIDQGKISTNRIDQLSKRLTKIYSILKALIERYRPSCVVVEKLYSHYRHPATSYLLGSARGIIHLVCGQENIPLVEYSSTRVKKTITGRGTASKLQVQKMVEYLLSLKEPIKSFDISDALSLAIAHAYISKTAKWSNC